MFSSVLWLLMAGNYFKKANVISNYQASESELSRFGLVPETGWQLHCYHPGTDIILYYSRLSYTRSRDQLTTNQRTGLVPDCRYCPMRSCQCSNVVSASVWVSAVAGRVVVTRHVVCTLVTLAPPDTCRIQQADIYIMGSLFASWKFSRYPVAITQCLFIYDLIFTSTLLGHSDKAESVHIGVFSSSEMINDFVVHGTLTKDFLNLPQMHRQIKQTIKIQYYIWHLQLLDRH